VHLLDDGFQHRQLTRDVDILLIDREDWRDWLLPAGNLREPLLAAHRASVIAIPAEQRDLEIALRRWGWQGPIWRLRRKMDTGSYGGPVAAFCGIGRPEQFFQGLEAAGVKLAARLSYPDHFVYTAEILKQMIAEAHESGAVAMVTTGKDLARMGKLASIFTKSMPLVAARLYVDIENKDAVLDWLEDQLGKRSARASVPNAARLPQSSNRAQ
jgi:tetraacyldisaccharide 4'-kinase